MKLCNKIILLTATPVINYLNDFSVLINLVKFKDVLPTEKNLFNTFYFNEDNFTFINKELLIDKIKNCVSFYKQPKSKNYPSSSTEKITIDMDKDQLREYSNYVYRFFYYYQNPDKKKDDLYYVDFTTLDKRKKNSFLSATRQLSNIAENSASSPKIEAIFNKIKEGPYPIIVYSNFLKRGIYALARLLEINDISYTALTGSTTDDKINYIVNNYNSLKFQVLLISSAGSESLDLSNTRSIHIMEPHWNESKITQVIGRAIRYNSHKDLPEKDRNVKIYRWISVFPIYINNQSADEYLSEISEKKLEIFQQFEKIIKETSIEHNNEISKKDYYRLYNKYKKEYVKMKKSITI